MARKTQPWTFNAINVVKRRDAALLLGVVSISLQELTLEHDRYQSKQSIYWFHNLLLASTCSKRPSFETIAPQTI